MISLKKAQDTRQLVTLQETLAATPPGRLISLRGDQTYPSRSCDLTPRDFFSYADTPSREFTRRIFFFFFAGSASAIHPPPGNRRLGITPGEPNVTSYTSDILYFTFKPLLLPRRTVCFFTEIYSSIKSGVLSETRLYKYYTFVKYYCDIAIVSTDHRIVCGPRHPGGYTIFFFSQKFKYVHNASISAEFRKHANQ